MINEDEPIPASPASKESIVIGPPGSLDLPATDSAAFIALPPESPLPTTAVRKAVISSAAWTMIGFALMQVLRLGSSIVLNRTLGPMTMGLYNLVFVFITALHMFSDVGVNTSIVQSKHGEDPNFRNTAWTIQVLRGCLLWFCAALIAWPVAVFWEQPLLLLLIPIIGVNEAISGLDSTALPLLRRRMQRARLVLLELATYIFSISVTLVWVSIQPTIWALVTGSILGALLQMAGSRLMIPGHRDRFRWDRGAVYEIVHFGKWLFLSTAFTFFAAQTADLVIGKLSIETLGVYGPAARLAGVPTALMLSVGLQLAFPLYSRMHHEGRDVHRVFHRVHPAAAGLGAVLVAGLIGTGPSLIACLYGEPFRDAGWMLQIVACGAWFQILEIFEGSLLLAMGRARGPAFSNGAKVLTLAALTPLGLYWYFENDQDLTRLLLAFAAADFVRYAATLVLLRRAGISVLGYDLLLTLLIAGSALSAILVGRLTWIADDPWLQLLAAGSTVLLIWAGVAGVCWSRGMFRLSGIEALRGS